MGGMCCYTVAQQRVNRCYMLLDKCYMCIFLFEHACTCCRSRMLARPR